MIFWLSITYKRIISKVIFNQTTIYNRIYYYQDFKFNVNYGCIIWIRFIFTYHIYIINRMRSLLKLKIPFSSKKLGIADTAKVIQDKILGITQVVSD